MKRRDFISTTLKTVGIIGLTPIASKVFANNVKYANDIVELGNTGIRTSRFAIGTGTNGWAGSSNQTRQLKMQGLSDLLHYAFDKGVFFWDSADQYGSHAHLKHALKTLPREKIVILSKTRANSADEMEADLERFRQEIGTDYIDIILLHAVTSKNWTDDKSGAMDVLSLAKQNKIIRAHGVSCHSIDALRLASETDWVEVDMARFNPGGVAMDDTPEIVATVLKKMKNRGVGTIGMKVFGAGKLINRYDECLAYHINSDLIDCSTVGFESIKQFDFLRKRVEELS